jgi:hypothetical protein
MAGDAKPLEPKIDQNELSKTLEEVEYSGRKVGPRVSVVIAVICALWSLFQLWIASPFPYTYGIGIITDVPARGVHLAFGLLLAFLLFPFARKRATDRIPIYDLILALLGVGSALYLFLGWDGLVSRQGVLLEIPFSLFGQRFEFPFEAILGGTGIVLLLEATRRAIGLPLVIVASVFLLYSVFGQWMPDIISHKGVSLNRLIGYQWLTGEAIFGIPIDVSVSFVYLFVLFGAILDKAGAGQYFLNLAFAMVGRFRGGPAKAAILASGMTGMISGSSIANVVTTGTFTIPVMIRLGMPATKAGAIEGGVHQRSDDAADHGRGGLYHGRVHRHLVLRRHCCRCHPRAAGVYGAVLYFASRGVETRIGRSTESGNTASAPDLSERFALSDPDRDSDLPVDGRTLDRGQCRFLFDRSNDDCACGGACVAWMAKRPDRHRPGRQGRADRDLPGADRRCA